MTVCGIDVGSVNTKAVLLDRETGHVLACAVRRTELDPSACAGLILADVEQSAGRAADRVSATGYGRHHVAQAQRNLTEISALALGISRLLPAARTVIDIGGQDSKVVRVDARGRATAFALNDRCAAGTGHFLETMADALHLATGELGDVDARSTAAVTLSSLCTVMARSEILGLAARHTPVPDLVAGIHRAVARRVANLALESGIEPEVAFCGGTALNAGMRRALEATLGLTVVVPAEPLYVCALGAAAAA